MTSFLSFGPPWLTWQTLFKDDSSLGAGRLPGTLIAAVAGIVSVAAEKARRSGHLGALREAIEAALAPANESGDPREGSQADLPRIADADPALEAIRLGALAAGGR